MGTRRRALKSAWAIGASAKELLLDLLDQPDPTLSAAAFEHYLGEGRSLLAAGLLKVEGHEPFAVSTDHEDAPIQLLWSPDHDRFGYFSPNAGWISVDDSSITQYRVDIVAFINGMFGRLGLKTGAVHPIAGNTVWDLGDIRLPHRTHRTPAWLVRCVGRARIWVDARSAMSARPATLTRLLLASTHRHQLPPDVPKGNVLVSLHDVIPGTGNISLEGDALGALLDGRPTRSTPGQPLVVIGQGHEVHFFGKVFRIARGYQQRRIICYLEERYKEGEIAVPVAEVVSELDLRDGARIRDYFKSSSGQRVMAELLFESGGMCGFRFGDTPVR